MADNWYYGRKGQQVGPLTDQQLKQLADSGQLQPTDLVWRKGMAQWVKANQIKGLLPGPQTSAAVTPQVQARPVGQASPETTKPVMASASPIAATPLDIEGWTTTSHAQPEKRPAIRGQSWGKGSPMNYMNWAQSLSMKQKVLIGVGGYVGLMVLCLAIIAVCRQFGSGGGDIRGFGGQLAWQNPTEGISQQELDAMKDPVAIAEETNYSESLAEAKKKIRSHGYSYIHLPVFGTRSGEIYLHGKKVKELQWWQDDSGRFAVQHIDVFDDSGTKRKRIDLWYGDGGYKVIEYGPGGSTEITHAMYYKNGNKQSETLVNEVIGEETARLGTGSISAQLHPTIEYYENGQKAAKYYHDPREDHYNPQFWDKHGNPIDQNTYCKARYGETWAYDYAKSVHRYGM